MSKPRVFLNLSFSRTLTFHSAGKRFKAGVVLYDGEATVPFGDGLYAVPIRHLWEEA